MLRSSTNPLVPSAISFTFTGDTPGVLPNELPASNSNVPTVFTKGATLRSLAPCARGHRGPKVLTTWDLWGRAASLRALYEWHRDAALPLFRGRADPCRLPALR
ncbi:hypothetical protein GCM10027200_22750 [Lentzea nigeriaca]